MGLLWADENANLLDPAAWTKSPQPVLQTCFEHGVYGPGHNSFTVSEDGATVLLVYHARTYTEIEGDGHAARAFNGRSLRATLKYNF